MARFTTEIIIDSETFETISVTYSDYTGPADLCKGGNSKAEMQQANQINQQELGLMQQQLGMQQGQINMVNPTLQQIIANGGMLPQEQQALTAQAINSLPQQYQALQGQINNQLVQRGMTGGQMAGSGGVAGSFGALGSAEANQQSNLLSQIQQMKAQGLNQAMGTALGVGQMYGQNVGTFNQGGLSALNSGVTAANNADQAQTGFFGSLFGALSSPFSISKSF